MRETFTAKLETANKDGSPHVTTIWFVLDESEITQHNDCFDIRPRKVLTEKNVAGWD
jgi:hypothetical protein